MVTASTAVDGGDGGLESLTRFQHQHFAGFAGFAAFRSISQQLCALLLKGVQLPCFAHTWREARPGWWLGSADDQPGSVPFMDDAGPVDCGCHQTPGRPFPKWARCLTNWQAATPVLVPRLLIISYLPVALLRPTYNTTEQRTRSSPRCNQT